jgi:glycosyltransferase involved in cell wall biosynthesis
VTAADGGAPRIAVVGWRLGGELERAIRVAAGRVRYVVVSMALDEDLVPLVEWHRMPVTRWSSYRVRWLVFFVLGGLRVARVRADAVHCIGPTPIIPNRADLNTVTFCHAAFDAATAGGRLKGSAARFGWRAGQRLALGLERWWFGRVRALGGISDGGVAELRRHYPAAEVVLTPRGIDTGRFRPDPAAGAALRAEEGIAPGDVVAVFVDQDHRPLKGLDVAIEGLAAAADRGGPDLLLVLGARNDACAGLAGRLGVADRVRFLGYRRDVERVYQAADLFVLPTVYEAFCRAAHEAAACGIPIVATPVSGLRELIGPGDAGVAVAREPGAVAAALVRLGGDAGLRARMGAVARGRALAYEEERSARRIVERHEALVSASARA